jgi:hypothetical protein
MSETRGGGVRLPPAGGAEEVIRLKAAHERLEAIQQAIDSVVDGEPVSDFMMSHNEVRDIFDLKLRADKAEAALASQPEGWQPIASAPKDRTPILVWDGFDMMVSAWMPELNDWYARYALCAEPPTHWRHLPPPPAGEPGTHE